MSVLLQAGKEFMGRCALPLTQFINEEGLEDELWLPLGKGSWTNLEGPVSGAVVFGTVYGTAYVCVTTFSVQPAACHHRRQNRAGPSATKANLP